MNTPPKIKRFGQASRQSFTTAPGGQYVAGLSEPDYALLLAAIATGFVHLENFMANFLAILLDDEHYTTAGYILRSIISPKGRIDVMQDLLECAPHNKDLGPDFDEVIREFGSISRARNEYIHGLWWTSLDGLEPYLAAPDDHGFGFFVSEKGTKDQMQALVERIWALHGRVVTLSMAHHTKKRSAKESSQPFEAPKED